MIALKNILVATDFSEPSDVALAYGRELAMRFDATLYVLHVVQHFYFANYGVEGAGAMGLQIQQDLENDALARMQALLIDSDNSGPRTTSAIRVGGSPAYEIVEYAKANGIGLIVMGTHGRGAFAHLMMGSVAERVVRLAPCPVLTVRHPERDFVHPDTLSAVTRA